ncbi:recombinase zinc beta ribbon domain-containing protein [Bacillus licheniformis]|uniref:recombinase zinc beta ribbon domain-containing protein n=1 Tax=Bacillus licheniformis TaxID=1402 RepID=UPI001B112C0C|nr:recombinase zinc beta ribbon domain-containing protein [Bacillus licheniformis]GIN25616.1 hypothetical protein J31TS2_21960 [Bacillus licheniformis]GIN29645.1 hypothetical protein J2TS5_16840 [Bacillus licheniformis]
MSLLKGLIYCSKCGKKHKFKKRAKKHTYVCSTYDNYGANHCSRNQINEDEVLWLISGHFNIFEDEIDRSFIQDNISKIIGNPESEEVKVIYKNGEESIYSSSLIIR